MTNYHWKAVSEGPSGPTLVKIGKLRRDGKHMVTYCYQRTIRKLETADTVAELRTDPQYRTINV